MIQESKVNVSIGQSHYLPNNDLRISEHTINWSMRFLMSKQSIKSWCVWHTAIELSRDSDIDDRSQVFSRRSALKLRSACADDAGDTISRRTQASICLYSDRTQAAYRAKLLPLIPMSSLACCGETFAVEQWGQASTFRNIDVGYHAGCWKFRLSVCKTFSISWYFIRPTPLNRSVRFPTALSMRLKNIGL